MFELRQASRGLLRRPAYTAASIGTLALVDSLVFGPSAIVYRVDPSADDPSDLSKDLNIATPWATGSERSSRLPCSTTILRKVETPVLQEGPGFRRLERIASGPFCVR